jgi:hypothetical protein
MQPRTLLAAGLDAALAAALAASIALPATAQTAAAPQPAPAQVVPQTAPPAGSNWQHVMALPINTDVHVAARKSHALCTLKRIDDNSLTCERDTGVGTKELTFQRNEIKTIKLARRGRSAFIGASIGAGAGATAGAIYACDNHYFAVRGAFAMIYALAGVFAGAPTGYLTDFTASTVYRAK